jgi:hypothetical protein
LKSAVDEDPNARPTAELLKAILEDIFNNKNFIND